VKNGIREQIASAHITLDNGWHEMKIIQHNTHFEGYLDGKKLLGSDNGDCSKSGGTGLWTKADAATIFDDFKVSTVTK
jgi:hypothetical protein